MNKFSIIQLEVARKDPKQFATNLKATSGTKQSFFRRSKLTRWQDAVGEYHKTNDLAKAINYLEKSFSQRADTTKNRNEVSRFINSLDAYVTQYTKNGFVLLERRKRIKIILNSKVFIGGQVPIIYMNAKGGFSIYFVVQSSIVWESELRFPVLQKYFAEDIFGVGSDKVEVGVFSTHNDKFSQRTFSEDEIKGADKELKKLGKVFYDIL